MIDQRSWWPRPDIQPKPIHVKSRFLHYVAQSGAPIPPSAKFADETFGLVE